MDKKHCAGCSDDFYNGKNPMGVKECWMLKTAKIVTLFRIGTWTVPTQLYAFTKCKVPHCFHRDGEHYYDKLPSFVDKKEVADESTWRKT